MKNFEQWLDESFTHFATPTTKGKVMVTGPGSGGRDLKSVVSLSTENIARMLAGALGIDYPNALLPADGSIDWLSPPLSKTAAVRDAANELMDYANENQRKKLLKLGGDGDVQAAITDVTERRREASADISSHRDEATHYFVNSKGQVVLLAPNAMKKTKENIGWVAAAGGNPPSSERMARAITGVDGFRHPELEPLTNFRADSNAAPRPIVRRILTGDIKYLPGYGRELSPEEVHHRMK